jgi:hypothetical protein
MRLAESGGATIDWRARKLAATVGDPFVHGHIELGAAARQPNMKRKHVAMLTGEDFVAGLNDQLVTLIVEPLAGMIRGGSSFLRSSPHSIGRDRRDRHRAKRQL